VTQRDRAAQPQRLAASASQAPLVLALLVQAALLFADLGRLPVWGDEQSSLTRAALPIDALLAVLRDNVHPALYFGLLHGWLAALGSVPAIVAARALSALFVLAATLVIDRCWLRDLEPRSRTWFLLLWTLSPALLLYGRMARSYSLQVLLASLALYAGWRYAGRASPRAWLAYVAAATALLYTHYLPGVAVIGGVALVMAWRAVADRRAAALLPLLAAPAGIGLAFAPWVLTFTGAVEHVATAERYHVFGRALDAAAALAYTAVSFSIGESVQPWMLGVLLALGPGLVVLLLAALRPPPAWLALVAAAAVIGFAGAGQWVSYAFVAPRLLFLLPFYLLVLVRGASAHPRLGALVCGGLALASIGGIAAYFAEAGFLNKAYVIPADAIAHAILADSDTTPITVILDHHSTDLTAVLPYLPADARTVLVTDAASAAAAAHLADDQRVEQVWFAHSVHDASAAGWNERVAAAFAPSFTVRRTGFVPYSALDGWLMRLAGWSERPQYAVQLDELRRRGSGR
jgi:hypothetical protein